MIRAEHSMHGVEFCLVSRGTPQLQNGELRSTQALGPWRVRRWCPRLAGTVTRWLGCVWYAPCVGLQRSGSVGGYHLVGTYANRSTAIIIDYGSLGGKTIAFVASGLFHLMAVGTSSSLYAWGNNNRVYWGTAPKSTNILCHHIDRIRRG